MFKPLALYIGLRYIRVKKKNHFASFVSFSSMLGIGLGVMVLITVLSVMNGFDKEIHHRFFNMVPEIMITGVDGNISNWQTLANNLQGVPGIKAVAPYVGEQGLLSYEGQVLPIMLTGILPEKEELISHLKDKLLLGSLDQLSNFGIVIGRGIADRFGLMLGDKVTIMIAPGKADIISGES